MTRTVTLAKGAERWEFPADHPLLPQLRDAARLWGVTVTDEPASVTKEFTKMNKPKDVIKRAAEYGDVYQAALMDAVTKRAVKEHPDAATPEIAFAKHLAANPGLRHIIDAAPVAAPAAPRTSYEALAKGAAEHARKSGTVLPSHSPYLPYLKATSVEGSRDGADQEVIDETDLALKNTAQSLVDSGQFSSLEIALRYVRTSPKYRGIAGSAAGYRDAIAGMRR